MPSSVFNYIYTRELTWPDARRRLTIQRQLILHSSSARPAPHEKVKRVCVLMCAIPGVCVVTWQADSILIDEARTPLIISKQVRPPFHAPFPYKPASCRCIGSLVKRGKLLRLLSCRVYVKIPIPLVSVFYLSPSDLGAAEQVRRGQEAGGLPEEGRALRGGREGAECAALRPGRQGLREGGAHR